MNHHHHTHKHATRTTPHNTRQEQHHKRPHEEPPPLRKDTHMSKGQHIFGIKVSCLSVMRSNENELPPYKIKEEKQVTHTHTHTRHEQQHTTHDHNNTTTDHTKNHPPHLTTIEGERHIQKYKTNVPWNQSCVCLAAPCGSLAFTRYCHCQYCVVDISITGVRGGPIALRNSVGDDWVGWGA